MKKLTLYALLSMIISNYCIAQCDWYCTYPYPTMNSLAKIKIINQNNIIAAGIKTTILLSTNSGLNWQELFCNSNDTLKAIFFSDSNTGFIAGTEGGNPPKAIVYKTINKGLNWIRIIATDNFVINTVSFINSNTGFAGGIGGQGNLLQTTNGGINWMVTSLPNVSIKSMQFTSYNSGYIAGEYFDTLKIFKTTNNGNNWQLVRIRSYTRVNGIYFLNVQTGFIFGDRQPPQIAVPYLEKTTNGGQNWYSVHFPNSIITDIKFTTELTGYSVGNIFGKTTNGGENWTQLLQVSAMTRGLSIDFMNLNTGFVSSIYGSILMTSNSGLNWNFSSQHSLNEIGGYVDKIYFWDSYKGYAIVSQYFLTTSNSGNTWERTYSTYPFFEDFSVVDSSTIFACLGAESSGSIIKSTNNGYNWTTLISNNSRPSSISFLNQNTGYCSFINTLFKTTNSGLNWNLQNVNFTAKNTGDIIIVDSNVIYVNALDKIMKTTNGGVNWFNAMLPGFGIQALFFFNEMVGFAAGYSGIIYKTTTGGQSWNSKYNSSSYFDEIHFLNSNTGIAVGDLGKIIKTTNSGENWFPLNSPVGDILNGTLVSVFITDSNVVHIGGGYYSYIFKSINGGSTIGIQNINSEIPRNFLIFQNYPNPFNPLTKIKFDVPKTSFTKIIIYDILGREVATLVNEELKPGTYEADWNAAGFSSGVYFYKIIAGDYKETKKMVLMK